MSYLQPVSPKSKKIPSIVTSVRPENFKSLKDSKKYAHGQSMYDMSQEIQRLQEEIERLRAMDNHRHM